LKPRYHREAGLRGPDVNRRRPASGSSWAWGRPRRRPVSQVLPRMWAW